MSVHPPSRGRPAAAPTLLPVQRRPLSRRAAAIRLALLMSAGLAATGSAPPAQAQSAEAPRAYAIAPGPLSQTLNAYASAAGVELTMNDSLLQGKRSDGIHGSYSVGEGFAALLRGHGLQAARERNGSYTLQPAPPRRRTPPRWRP